ncbi:IS110 family transposase [Amycolatopsis sp. NPDC005003]
MLAAGRRFTDRVWAMEGCNGVGRHVAHRLVHEGETVLDVPAKLSAQVRVFATGNGRKTDPVDAHSLALAALRAPDLTRVQADPELVVMTARRPRLRSFGAESAAGRDGEPVGRWTDTTSSWSCHHFFAGTDALYPV